MAYRTLYPFSRRSMCSAWSRSIDLRGSSVTNGIAVSSASGKRGERADFRRRRASRCGSRWRCRALVAARRTLRGSRGRRAGTADVAERHGLNVPAGAWRSRLLGDRRWVAFSAGQRAGVRNPHGSARFAHGVADRAVDWRGSWRKEAETAPLRPFGLIVARLENRYGSLGSSRVQIPPPPPWPHWQRRKSLLMWPTSERCPSWPKERDWKSRPCGNVGCRLESRPLASLTLRESDQIRDLLRREVLPVVPGITRGTLGDLCVRFDIDSWMKPRPYPSTPRRASAHRRVRARGRERMTAPQPWEVKSAFPAAASPWTVPV